MAPVRPELVRCRAARCDSPQRDGFDVQRPDPGLAAAAAQQAADKRAEAADSSRTAKGETGAEEEQGASDSGAADEDSEREPRKAAQMAGFPCGPPGGQ